MVTGIMSQMGRLVTIIVVAALMVMEIINPAAPTIKPPLNCSFLSSLLKLMATSIAPAKKPPSAAAMPRGLAGFARRNCPKDAIGTPHPTTALAGFCVTRELP